MSFAPTHSDTHSELSFSTISSYSIASNESTHIIPNVGTGQENVNVRKKTKFEKLKSYGTATRKRITEKLKNLGVQNGSVPVDYNCVPYNIDEMPWWKIFIKFVGPGAMVAVGYIDPGNWATDLEAGSRFYYNLLCTILFANICAVLLQSLTVKAGIVTGNDLAQLCRLYSPKYLNYFLYVTAEIAIIATDLAEVIGSAIALYLLLGIPLPWGVAITGLDVLIILFGFDSKRLRYFEFGIIILVAIVAACFISLISKTNPIWSHVFLGFVPRGEIFTNHEELFIGIAIIGATVMPHNLYLHSNLVLYRYNPEATLESFENLGTKNENPKSNDFPLNPPLSHGISTSCQSIHSDLSCKSSIPGNESNNQTTDVVDVPIESVIETNNTTEQEKVKASLEINGYQEDAERRNSNSLLINSAGLPNNSPSATENTANDILYADPFRPTNQLMRTEHSDSTDNLMPYFANESLAPKAISITTGSQASNRNEDTDSKKSFKMDLPPEPRVVLPVTEEAREYKVRQWIHKRLIANNLKYSYIDTFISLTFALFINCMILIVSASAFYKQGYNEVASIPNAYELLARLLSRSAANVFAFALLCSGQSATITGTIAGQIVMNGFLSGRGRVQKLLSRRPWLRRLITRSVAIIPAMIVSILMGMDGVDRLLVISQVILSFQLPFAVWPLIYITSRKKYMTVVFEYSGKDEFPGKQPTDRIDADSINRSETEDLNESPNTNVGEPDINYDIWYDDLDELEAIDIGLGGSANIENQQNVESMEMKRIKTESSNAAHIPCNNSISTHQSNADSNIRNTDNVIIEDISNSIKYEAKSYANSYIHTAILCTITGIITVLNIILIYTAFSM